MIVFFKRLRSNSSSVHTGGHLCTGFNLRHNPKAIQLRGEKEKAAKSGELSKRSFHWDVCEKK